MIFDFLFKWIKNPIVLIVIIVGLMGSSYRVGYHNASKDIKEKDQVIAQVNHVAQQENNREINDLNTAFGNKAYEQLELSNTLQATADRWGNIIDRDPALSVPIVTPATETVCRPDRTPSDTRKPVTRDDVYQAQLSREAIQFLKGEAARADYCAVQLTDREATIRNIQQQVDNYNQLLKKRGFMENEILKLRQ